LRVVGGRAPHIPGVRVEERPWRLDREVEEFQTLEIGLAPMFDDLWSLGKCAFKQIQYMAAGVPFVSSPVGAARQLLTHDETTLFAGTSEEWEHALGRLLRSPELRRRLAVRARQVFEQRYSLEVQSPIFVDEIVRVLRQRGSGEARGPAASE
jgi:glycosyltransferase involved in cell wall biosynthesis